MKFQLFTASFLAVALSASAQSSLSISDQVRLRELRAGSAVKKAMRIASPAGAAASAESDTPVLRTLAMVQLAEGVTEADLKAQGVDVLRVSHGFAFISVPLDDVERVASIKSFKSFQLERPVAQKMKYARKDVGVDKLHQGIGLSQAYTGKGVVCGILDMGFDPNHLNFQDADGNPRVKYIERLTKNNNATSATDLIKIDYYNTPEQIQAYTTDSKDDYHGTHTMGIMAGGYRGTAKVATLADGNDKTAVVTEEANPYYGVAYDADIVAASAESLTDIQIAYGVEDLVHYGQSVNKPIVINLSLGTNQGSHDGKSSICQFFDKLTEDDNAKIVLASGNEGMKKVAVNKTFKEDGDALQSFISGDYYTMTEGKVYARNGQIDIYTDDLTPLTSLQAVIYNTDRNKVTKRFELPIDISTMGTGKTWVTSNYAQYENDIVDLTMEKYFSGQISLYWQNDSLLGRSHAIISFYLIDNPENNKDMQYKMGFIATGKKGQRVDAYAAGYAYGINSFGINGWDDGSSNGSISDMACAQKTLCVGSYNSTGAWAQLNGFAYHQDGNDLVPGEVTPLTSYGTLSDGRNLPDVLAPGAYIVSSANRHYLYNDSYQAEDSLLSALATKGEEKYPFIWSYGTSMATPVVSGIIALWLEADPTLTMDEIRDIIKKTSRFDDAMKKADPVQVGAGKIDAYEGLKEVLRRKGDGSSISSVSSDADRLVLSQAGERQVKVFLAGAKTMNVSVITSAGQTVLSQQTDGDESLIDLSSLSRGTYIIRANGKSSKCILVK